MELKALAMSTCRTISGLSWGSAVTSPWRPIAMVSQAPGTFTRFDGEAGRLRPIGPRRRPQRVTGKYECCNRYRNDSYRDVIKPCKYLQWVFLGLQGSLMKS